MQQHRISNLLDPREAQDCATKFYVDNSMFADRLIGSNSIIMHDLDQRLIPVIKVPLTSNPGMTIKLIFTFTLSRPMASTSITQSEVHTNRSIHFVSAYTVSDNIPIDGSNATHLGITIPDLTSRSRMSTILATVMPFYPTSMSLSIGFFEPPSDIRTIKIDVYKSYA